MLKFTGWMTMVLFFLLVVATGAHALATRTWVSGVGDNLNPCSRTAPCKTFAGAISNTAAGGEINVLDPGDFGAVIITKALTINGSGGSIAGILAPGSNGIEVNAGANDSVILRNLDINGMGTGLSGILFLNGKSLRVENSKIYGFNQYGFAFEPAAASTFSIDRTVLHNNVLGGLYVKPGANPGSAYGTVSGSSFSNNQFGVWAEDRSMVTVSNSVAGNNFGNGFMAQSTTDAAEITLSGAVASGNVTGVEASGTRAVVYMSGTATTQNTTGIMTMNSGSVLSHASSIIIGNTNDGVPTGYLPQYSGALVIY